VPEGRAALLTGVTGGWGRAVLDRFVEHGWNVCVAYIGDAGGLPDGVLGVETDLTDADSAQRAADACRERFGSVDALVCVAGGFAMAGGIHEQPLDVWRKQFALNLDTAYTITRAVVGGMLEQGSGSIVYVGSRAALRPFPGASGYIVSKAAVIALMQAVDAEVRTHGVRANVIVPNVVDTPRNRDENPDADFTRWTTGAELARVIEWLCGDDSAPLSGGVIPAYGRS
jgi:NAD(P)-dependent dehydrogenase (short-subunit alcohol dehydrogenase family)